MDDTISKQKIADCLTGINQSSIIKFQSSAWPLPKEEEWRRTNLSKFDMSGFKLLLDPVKESGKNTEVPILDNNSSLLVTKYAGVRSQIQINEIAAEDIVLYEPEYPTEIDEKTSVIVQDLAEAVSERIDNKTEYLAASSFKDTLFIIIPDNIELEKPLIVEFDAIENKETFLPNLFIYAGKNVQVKIIQRIHTGNKSSVSGLLSVVAEENSNIHIATVSDAGNNSLTFINRYFRLLSNTFLSDFQSSSGGSLIKTRSVVDIVGEKADARLYGVNFADNKSHIDMRTVQLHRSKDCFSQAIIKTVVKDHGRCIYQGLIEVEEGAPLTDAYLTNHNLVLNNGARADSIPSLKIRNNNVKCSHGATTGKINADQILYLTSRGIGEKEARQMILEGFFSHVYDQLSEDIKSYCYPFIMDKLIIQENTA